MRTPPGKKTRLPFIDGGPFQAFYIHSEPGDATRYEYFCIVEDDRFWFVSKEGTIRYPSCLHMWQIRAIGYVPDIRKHPEDRMALMAELSKEHNCNPFTIVECVRTILEIVEMRKE